MLPTLVIISLWVQKFLDAWEDSRLHRQEDTKRTSSTGLGPQNWDWAKSAIILIYGLSPGLCAKA